MQFAIVEFLCDNSCSVVQESWLDEDKKKCNFPPNKFFSKFIQKETKPEKVKSWKQYDIKIIRENIDAFGEANELAKYTSEFGDTEGENTVRRDKENKRKRIIMGETLDLRGEMKKAKIDDSNSSHNLQQNKSDSINGVEEENYVNHYAENNGTTDEILSTQIERLDIDTDSLILMEVRKIVTEAKIEICQKIDEVMEEVRNINLQNGYSPLKKFVKIKSTKMFNSFIELMKVEQKKVNIIHELKSCPDTTNSKNVNHGKIATMIEYLFSPKFIIKRLKWGEMNGQEKSTDRTIYLVNYPVFLELGTALLANSTPKDIRTSFQIYFKHRAKKLIVE